MINKNLSKNIERDGYFLKDNLPVSQLFKRIYGGVLTSWKKGGGWNTGVKNNSSGPVILKRRNEENVLRIRSLINNSRQTGFQYLYHLINETNNVSGLIKTICNGLLTAWKLEINTLAGLTKEPGFSKTGCTKGCFPGKHADFSENKRNRKVTLLLYFGALEFLGKSYSLFFNNRGRVTEIIAKPNRSILFIPGPETEHWAEEPLTNSLSEYSGTRLAFSGRLI